MASIDTNPVLRRVADNIAAVSQDPTTPIDTRAFDEAALLLPDAVSGDARRSIVRALAGLLPQLRHDPTPAIHLLLRLIHDFTYADILSFGADGLPYVDGLAVGDHMVAVNRLMLTILAKATAKPADAAHVASMLDTMHALVTLWLSTADTGVASLASRLLLNLLRIDREIQTDPDAHVPDGGQGLVWRRVFGDRNVYGTIFEACSLTGPSSLQLSKSQRTLAQARLMEWLPEVGAMDWSSISRSHHVDLERKYGVEGGLLQFAAVHMVDYEDDVLMHRCLIDFYSSLLRSFDASSLARSGDADSPALIYLIGQGLHARTAAMYLQLPGAQLGPVESMFLYGPSANYISTYATNCPGHYLASQMPKQVNDRLTRALDLSSTRWAHAESPKHDLHLMASLPRQSLLPGGDGGGPWSSSPLSLIPSKQTNADALNTLATLFRGPEQRIISVPRVPLLESAEHRDELEGSSARTLYYHYVANHPTFWDDLAKHADTVALKELALAAISCLTAVITANWSATPDLILPSTIATPEQGHVAILTPPALEYALPYLLRPPKTFANLVGGRGDAESAAFKIAMAKYDALRLLHARLLVHVQQQPGQGFEEIIATLGKALAEGPMSREGEVGGRIGTMEL